jgi:hypothetical protein
VFCVCSPYSLNRQTIRLTSCGAALAGFTRPGLLFAMVSEPAIAGRKEDVNKKEIQQLYEHSDMTISAICQTCAITRNNLYKMIEEGCWKPRLPNRWRSYKTRSRRAIPTAKMALAKLKVIALGHIDKLEDGLAETDPPASIPDRERDIRSLRILLKVIEEINRLEQQLADTGQKASKKKAAEFDDKRRAELAQRLAVLQRTD